MIFHIFYLSALGVIQTTFGTLMEGRKYRSLGKINRSEKDFQCPGEGFHADARDCRTFYRCIDWTSNEFLRDYAEPQLTAFKFECGEGTIFDSDFNVCNHPRDSRRVECGGKKKGQIENAGLLSSEKNPFLHPYPASSENPQTFNKYPGPVNDKENQIMPEENVGSSQTPLSPLEPCKSPGFHPVKNDCQKFVQCVDNGNGIFIKHEFSCGPGTVWDPVNTVCNYPNAVSGCENEPTQKYPDQNSQSVFESNKPGQSSTSEGMAHPEQSGYPVGNGKPGQGNYPGSNRYPGQSGYPGKKPGTQSNQPGYPGSSGQTGQGGYPETSRPPGQEGFAYPGPSGYPDKRPSQIDYPGGSTYPGQSSHSGERPGGYPASSKYPEQGGYPVYPSAYPGPSSYPDRKPSSHLGQGYPGGSAYPGPSRYPDRKPSSHPGQGGYPGGSEYPGQNNYPDGKPGGYPTNSEYPGQGGYPEGSAYPEQSSYPNRRPGNHPGEGGYPGDSEYPGQGGYPGGSAYPGQSNYSGGRPSGQPGHGGYPGGSAYPGQVGYPGGSSKPGQGGYPEESESLGNPIPGGKPGGNENYPSSMETQPGENVSSVDGNMVGGMFTGKCTSPGFFGVPKNCKKFIRCVENNNGGYTQFDFECGDGTAWDIKLNTCNHASQVKECENLSQKPEEVGYPKPETSTVSQTSSSLPPSSYYNFTTTNPQNQHSISLISQTEISQTPTQTETTPNLINQSQTTLNKELNFTTDSYEQSSTNPMMPEQKPTTEMPLENENLGKPPSGSIPCDNNKISSQVKCEKPGFYPDPSDCRKFYRCVDWEDDKGEKFSIYYFECGNGTIWDPALEICNHEKSVYPPRDCRNLNQSFENSSTESTMTSGTTQNGMTTTELASTNQFNTNDTTTDTPAYLTSTTNQPESSFPSLETTTTTTNYQTTTSQPDSSLPSLQNTTTTQSPQTSTEVSETAATNTDRTETTKSSTYLTSEGNESTSISPDITTLTFSSKPPESLSTIEVTTDKSNEYSTLGSTEESNESTTLSQSEITSTMTGVSEITEATTGNTQSSETTQESLESTESSLGTSEPTESSLGTSEPTESSLGTSEPTESSLESSEPTESSLSTSEPTESSLESSEPTESSLSTSESTESSLGTSESTESSLGTSEPTESSLGTSEPTEYSFGSSEPTEPNESTTSGNFTTDSSETKDPNCPELNEDQAAYVCPTGFKRHPKDCNLFYQCTTFKDSGDLNIMLLSCKNNTVYDEKKIQCLPPGDAACQSQRPNRKFYKRAYTEFSSSIIYVSPNKRLCPSEGSFPYEGDCTRFYKCKKDRSGKIQGYLYQCPENYSFHDVSSKCEKSSKTPKCTRTIPEMNSNYLKWMTLKVPVEF